MGYVICLLLSTKPGTYYTNSRHEINDDCWWLGKSPEMDKPLKMGTLLYIGTLKIISCIPVIFGFKIIGREACIGEHIGF